MTSSGNRDGERALRAGFVLLLVMAALFGVLHWLAGDLRVEGVSWFNLDKERNLPTWFTGLLFFLFGCAAVAAVFLERRHNLEAGESTFRLPHLWLGVALVGWSMSLDEVTILHENLFWREVRWLSEDLGGAWAYLTQWQILFAPAIALVLLYLVIFFSNRLAGDRSARLFAFVALACWVAALLFEAIRETIKTAGSSWYGFEVLVEEELEMLGAIFLLAAISRYALRVARGVERSASTKVADRFLTPAALKAATVALAVVIVGAFGAFLLGRRLAQHDAPLPRLMRKASTERMQELEQPGQGESPSRRQEIWFPDLARASEVTPAEAASVARTLQASIYGFSSQDGARLPLAAAPVEKPRILFLSMSDGSGAAGVLVTSGREITLVVDEMLEQVGKILAAPRKPPQWMKVDLVRGVKWLGKDFLRRDTELHPGLAGLALAAPSGLAFLPEEVVVNRLIDGDGEVRPDRILGYLERQGVNDAESLLRRGSSSAYLFSAHSFFLTAEEIVPLFRGHRLRGLPEPSELLEAAERAGEYLTRAVAPGGRFAYSYRPEIDSVDDSYNILRHAGTIYSMLELYSVTRSPELLEATERALSFLDRKVRSCRVGSHDLPCVEEDGEVKLGGNALAAIAIAQHLTLTGDLSRKPLLTGLGSWLVETQADNGRFTIHKQAWPDGRIDDFISGYYPGEALLALLRIAEIDDDPRWVEAAARGARYLIEVRDGKLEDEELAHDHWLLYALNELHHRRPEPLFLNHAMRIATVISNAQNVDPEFPDWLGSYYRPPRSTPTATRTEGLAAAHALALSQGLSVEAETFEKAIGLGISFQLQTQITPETALYLARPERALGGFRRSFSSYQIRIDYVQHNISALLAYRRLLEASRER